VSLGRVAIENGTLIFSDSQAGLSVVAEKANFSASVGSIDGPYSLAGSATLNGTPLRLDLAVGAKAASGHIAEVALEAGGGKLSFKGTLSEFGPSAWRRARPTIWSSSPKPWPRSPASRSPSCRRCSPASSASTAASTSRRPPSRPGISSWRWARTAFRARSRSP
jgi:hypothetical protein